MTPTHAKRPEADPDVTQDLGDSRRDAPPTGSLGSPAPRGRRKRCRRCRRCQGAAAPGGGQGIHRRRRGGRADQPARPDGALPGHRRRPVRLPGRPGVRQQRRGRDGRPARRPGARNAAPPPWPPGGPGGRGGESSRTGAGRFPARPRDRPRRRWAWSTRRSSLSLGRRVAVKILPLADALDPRHLQRFRNEAQAAAQLHHTNIVPVYGVGCERSVHFYAMQLIEGQSLADVIRDLRESAAPARAAGGDSAGRYGLPDSRPHTAPAPPSRAAGTPVGSEDLTKILTPFFPEVRPPIGGEIGGRRLVPPRRLQSRRSPCGSRPPPTRRRGGPHPALSLTSLRSTKASAYYRRWPAWACRRPRRWTTPTGPASSTATSSPPTSCSTRAATSGSPTSAWPSSTATTGSPRPATCSARCAT